jgi:SAM-dependent methyltransferase
MGERVEVDKGDAHDLPYEDNEFDAVIMVNTLEFIDRRAQALAEAVRVAASRVLMISFNFWSPGYYMWRMRGEPNPFKQARPMGIMGMSRLIREVLGPVPKSWAGTNLWPNMGVGMKPLAALTGICAAVTPRFRTRGLIVKAGRSAKHARPASAVPAASSSSHISLLPPKNS